MAEAINHFNASARRAAIVRTMHLGDGDYHLPFPIYHCSLQPTCSSTYATEIELFGSTVAARWSRDGCGIAAIKAAVLSLNRLADPDFDMPSISELAEDTVRRGGYLSNIGWIHRSLIPLASAYGVNAFSRVGDGPDDICAEILLSRIPIVSVTLHFRGGQIVQMPDGSTQTVAKGGHLVIAKGFRWERGGCTGFFVDDCQDRELLDGQESTTFVNLTDFERSYSAKAIYLYR